MIKIFPLETTVFKLDGGAMFGVVPKKIWSRNYPADANNLAPWHARCLLIDDGHKRILIDTGVGDKQPDSFFSHYELDFTFSLQRSLAAIGYALADITDVILTHFHFDHVGGAVSRHEEDYFPTFPNATYWSNEAHFTHALNANDREKASFLPENIVPLKNHRCLRFVPVEQDLVFTEHIRFRFSFGHTEALIIPLIQYQNRTIAYVSDLFPSIGHLKPIYVPSYDIRPLISMDEKKQFLQEAYDNQYILFFEHDPYFECCTLTQTSKGIVCDKKGALHDFVQ